MTGLVPGVVTALGRAAKRTALSTALAAATAVGSGATLEVIGTAQPAQAASMTYQVTNYDNDGTHGVYLRNSSNAGDVNRDAAHYVTYGTSVQLICAESGSPVGPSNNTAWDYVQVLSGPNAGRYGHLSEHWINTPVGPNQHVAGEANCSGGTGQGDPAPNSAEQAAVNWANAQIGSSSWNGRCLSFVRNAWANGGVDLRNDVSVAWGSNTYPLDIWGHFKTGTTGTGAPSTPGSLVFFYGTGSPGSTTYRTNSHVMIYVGNGRYVSTDDYVASRVHVETYGQHARELGWWLPA